MFIPKTVEQIRDVALQSLAMRYQTETGDTIDVTRGSDAWMWMEVLALEIARIEAQCAEQVKQNLPDQASIENLGRWGDVMATPRETASAAVLSIQISGADGSYSLAGRTLQSAAGIAYAPVAPTTPAAISGGFGTVQFEASVAGTAGTLAVDAILQWSAAPAGMNPTAKVLSIVTAGVAEETQVLWADRIIALLRERPASGNRADFKAWVEAYAGVESGWVYA